MFVRYQKQLKTYKIKYPCAGDVQWEYMNTLEVWWDDWVSDRFFEVFSFAGAVRTVPQLVGAGKNWDICVDSVSWSVQRSSECVCT